MNNNNVTNDRLIIAAPPDGNTPLDVAVNWPVFPAGLDKRPLTPHGLLDATMDPDVIRAWWTRWPDANVAVRTGEPSQLVVLDVDGQAGADSLHELEYEHGKLPETTSVKTPRGGQHYYFTWPGGPVKTTAGVIAPGLDIRGDGGYVLVPPSRTDAGEYVWDSCAPLAPMPAWLVELTRDESATASAAKAPEEWMAMLRDGIPDGRRNASLTRLTGYLLRHWVDADVTVALVHVINEHCCQPPKSRGEVERIVASVAGIELRRRRRAAR